MLEIELNIHINSRFEESLTPLQFFCDYDGNKTIQERISIKIN